MDARLDDTQTDVLTAKVTDLVQGHAIAGEGLIYNLMDATLDMLETGRVTDAQRHLKREVDAKFRYTDAPDSYEFMLGAVWALMGLVERGRR